MPELIKVADLTKDQKSVVESVPRGTKLMQGPAGTGKTSAGVRRMLRLLTKDKIFANEILVLLPQKAPAVPYQQAIDNPKLDPGGRVTITTLGTLSRQMSRLFYPLVADAFNFKDPQAEPVFLTLEAAQYHMAHVAGELVEQHAYFDSVAIARNRLYSQIIDNLNKAALVGFPHTEIADRLIGAWGGKDPAQVTIYQQAQECANMFRAYCLEHSLVDFSLQVEMFSALWNQPAVRDHLVGRFRHLILDNVEEDVPVSHDILLDWIPEAESALVIMDTEASYRRFLGADAASASRLADLVTTNRDRFIFTEADSLVSSPPLRALGAHLAASFDQPPSADPTEADPRDVLAYDQPRFYTEMITNVTDSIAGLVHEQGIPPGEIVVLAPFLSDSLRYTLAEQLTSLDVPSRSHRPSRALREEPAAQALVTLAQLAHPAWELPPTHAEMLAALVASVAGLDLVRARLAVSQLYRRGGLQSFDALASGVQERVTYAFGEKLQRLHNWLANYEQSPVAELDIFWSRLFGEVLAQEGFGFHDRNESAEVAANLIDSARKFRQMMQAIPGQRSQAIAREYILMLRDGVIADQYLRSWQRDEDENSVLLAPAYTFLMTTRPVRYQFWLNVGSPSWWERLYQPLTHPYVLTRYWSQGRVWTDEDEYYTRNETLYRLALGMVRRCRDGIYLGFSEMGEQGFEQRGPLLEAFQRALRRLSNEAS